jgi:aminoglycoside phosphotransferase (APT) family kinase protein
MSQSAQQNFSGTRPVAPQHAFDEAALAAYLREHVEGFEGTLQVEQFKGGQSNPTFLLTVGAQRLVLRRKPPGALLASAHAVDREFRVIRALAGSEVPVARTHVLCEDPQVIGTAFYVMDYVDGRIFWDLALPGMRPAERTAIYDELNRVIAALHRVDPGSVGLADYGKPGARWRAGPSSTGRRRPRPSRPRTGSSRGCPNTFPRRPRRASCTATTAWTT